MRRSQILVPWMQRSAISAFTRVFDALISAFTRVFDALWGGALLIRGPS
jgi:hypothetical protein